MEQLIAIREMKVEIYIQILDENPHLSAQNLDLGLWFTLMILTWFILSDCVASKKIAIMPWPSMSPNWNSIENI